MKKKELQILYIITKLELGGAQKVCLALLNGTQEQGHTSFLIAGDGGILSQSVSHNKNVFLLNSLKREANFSSILAELKAFKDLVAQIKKIRKDFPHLIVHTHSTKAGIIGRWAAFFAGVSQRVHTIHGFAFHDHQSWPLWLSIYMVELLTSFITTHYVCVSSYDVRKAIKLFPRFAKKHSIIRAAVDPEPFFNAARKTTLENNTDLFVFGTVSCFKKQKNLFDMLQAFSLAHQKNNLLRLEIIGDGALRPALEAWIAHRNLQEVVILHGWQENVAPIMATWNAFILSSLWEGLPCAIVEARLLKLPVLAYDTGGIHDVIFNGENGLLYKPKHWQELAQGMMDISNNQLLYKKLSHYKDDLSLFDQNVMINQHLQLYRSF
ncbi:MAG TPA: glycosyltransferase [Candidatus Babeliales bacterium]|nr:glycosyltransferase [Candidatus Babeliales bacterium]